MKESAAKALIVRQIKKEGGFARRFEDQFAVGIPDMEVVLPNGPIFKIEAKILRGHKFGATARQLEELRRYARVSTSVVPCIMGIDPCWDFYVGVPAADRNIVDCEHGVGVVEVSAVLRRYYLNYNWREF